jgi:hypothetical protein
MRGRFALLEGKVRVFAASTRARRLRSYLLTEAVPPSLKSTIV